MKSNFTKKVGVYYKLPPNDNRIYEAGKRLNGDDLLKNHHLPLVTVITVVFNNDKSIDKCINSVINQSYNNIEYIIIDGASKDKTIEVIKQYVDKIDYVVSESDKGIYHAMNKGISLAKGEYIAMINSDDWLELDGIEKSINNILKNNADVSVGYANVWDKNNKFMHVWTIGNFDVRILLSGMSFCHQAVIASAQTYERTGLYDETIQISSDYKWVKEIFINKCKVVFTEEPIVNFSFDGVSANNRPIWKEECKQMVCEKFGLNYENVSDFLEYIYRDKPLNSLSVAKLSYECANNNELLHSLTMVLLDKLIVLEKVKKLPPIVDVLKLDSNNIQPKISVIIPIYNVEQYLEKCVQSVMNQSLTDIEIILVNDGSPDGSSRIIEKLAKNDARIIVINQDNAGLSAARNAGLDIAKGKFIHFLDSDDYIKHGMYEVMFKYAEKLDLDMVKSNLGFIDDIYPIKKPSLPKQKEVFTYSDCFDYFQFISPCATLYKRNLLERSDKFPVGVTYEDRPFNWQTIILSNKIGHIDKVFYMYRVARPGSIMNTGKGSAKHFDAFKAIDLIYSFLIKSNLLSDLNVEFVKEQLRVYSMLIDINAIPKELLGRFLLKCKERINLHPVSIGSIMATNMPERVKNLYIYLLDDIKKPLDLSMMGGRYFHGGISFNTSVINNCSNNFSSCDFLIYALSIIKHKFIRKENNRLNKIKKSAIESIIFDMIHFHYLSIDFDFLTEEINRLESYFDENVKLISLISSFHNAINTSTELSKHICFVHSASKNYIKISELVNSYFSNQNDKSTCFSHQDIELINQELTIEQNQLYGEILNDLKGMGLKTSGFSQQISAYYFVLKNVKLENLDRFTILFPFSPVERLLYNLLIDEKCKTVFIPHGLPQRSLHNIHFDYVMPLTITREWDVIFPYSKLFHIGWLEVIDDQKVNNAKIVNRLKKYNIIYLSQLSGAKVHRIDDFITTTEFFIKNVLKLDEKIFDVNVRLRDESEKKLINNELVMMVEKSNHIHFSVISDMTMSEINADVLVGSSTTALLYSNFHNIPIIQLTTDKIFETWPFMLSSPFAFYVLDADKRQFNDVLISTLNNLPMRMLYRNVSKSSIFDAFKLIYKDHLHEV